MTGKVAIGLQSFEVIRTRNIFYVDKTDFIRQWWENEDSVTLIHQSPVTGRCETDEHFHEQGGI